jgi:hypothetical protein
MLGLAARMEKEIEPHWLAWGRFREISPWPVFFIETLFHFQNPFYTSKTNFNSEKPCDQYLGLICDKSLTCRGLNFNLGHFGSFYFYLCLYGESRLLISWCVGGRCDITGSDEDIGRSRRPSADDWG